MDNLLKQTHKALEPFAMFIEADENTRDGPWVCEFYDYRGRRLGCGRHYPKTVAICEKCAVNYSDQDILIDIAGLKMRRGIWISHVKRLARMFWLIDKRLAKEAVKP